MSNGKSEFVEINKKVKAALDEFYENERNILDRDHGKGVCERSLAFRFGLYLYNHFEKDGIYVDNEFNKDGNSSKHLADSDRFIDLIVHNRETCNKAKNILFIEIKKDHNDSTVKIDRKKISEATDMNGKLKYQFGLHLFLENQEPKLEWYENGKKMVKK